MSIFDVFQGPSQEDREFKAPESKQETSQEVTAGDMRAIEFNIEEYKEVKEMVDKLGEATTESGTSVEEIQDDQDIFVELYSKAIN